MHTPCEASQLHSESFTAHSGQLNTYTQIIQTTTLNLDISLECSIVCSVADGEIKMTVNTDKHPSV